MRRRSMRARRWLLAAGMAVACGQSSDIAPRSGVVGRATSPLTALPVPTDAIVTTTVLDPAATPKLAAGTTKGELSVTRDGAASYKIPLWIPPGRKGIEPTLELAYNSRSKVGEIGRAHV